MYSPSFLEELKSKINLSEVISKKVSLKSRGRDYIGLCPFHNEKTPSFSVNDMKGFYHCFGCSAHGDIITFLMETEGLSFKDAIEKLAVDFGIPLPKLEKSKKTDKEREDIDILFDINEQACKFFEANIFKSFGKAGLIYAKKRGLTKANLKKFRIGFAFDDFNMLQNHLKARGFSKAEILKAGVISKSEKGVYDKFRNRLMFPVIDKRGRVIAFTGRVIDDGMPKYMNSPETKIYHKGDVLFNYFFARKAIYDEKYAVLVEGNLDAISLSIGGVENVVAPMGTAITENQLLDLWKGTDEIIICLDGDKAGKKASIRISNLVLPLIGANKNLKFAFMPDGVDPDNYIRQYGQNALVTLLKKALPLSEFIWYSETKKLKIEDISNANPESKVKLEKNLFNIVDKIQDTFSQKHFRDFFKNKFWSFKKTKNKIVKSQLSPALHNVVANHTVSKIKELIEKCEYQICSLIIKYPNLIERIFREYNIDIYSLNFYKKEILIILSILEKFSEDKNFNENNFKKELEKNGLNGYLEYNEIFLNHCSSSIDENKALLRINRTIIERDISMIEIELKETVIKNEDLEKIKILQFQLKKLKRKKFLLDNEANFV